MSDYGDNIKYKWTPESTTLLVSVWTDKQVQKQLEYAQRPQLIWESVARYMTKKGYAVSAKQCRSRMKQVLVCYREAKRVGTRAGVEQYYDSIDKVLKNKKMERSDNGFDTVDSAAIVKSPPKDVKTNKNLRMRYNRYSEPIESMVRTEALSPTWLLAHEDEYPDSPESNETVLAQPYRAFSPTRDAATNTLNGPTQMLAKNSRRSLILDEQPIRQTRVAEQSIPNNRFGEMIHQNTVQNVQNQIIQENMQHQQQRNLVNHNKFTQDEAVLQPENLYRRQTNRNVIFHSTDDNVPSKLRNGSSQTRNVVTTVDQPFTDNTTRMQNQLQQNCTTDNRAVPQEPRRGNFGQNLVVNYKLFKEATDVGGGYTEQNFSRLRPRTARNYSPETAANLNDAFCTSPKNERNLENLNDDYDQRLAENDVIRAMNATTITNNATFNDDTLSIEFLEGSASPSPSDNGAVGSKSGNSDRVPDAPVRKKKVQKLEHLMLSAITSQSEVVNKILAAQDAMVSRFLDLDRDRQNRLENRLDHLMNVMHATVINKSQDKDSDSVAAASSKTSEPTVITNLDPPPRPGAIPPRLDLVPPKPCRVPCTTANANVELVNQRTVETRPGVVSPIKQPGAIWTKLGPVSQSPFVKAQQQLGIRLTANIEARTQSSAERKIARELASLPVDNRTLVFECQRFLENERQTEENTENAKILTKMGNEVATRRKLFAGRGELNAGIILTAAFLDEERTAGRTDAVLTNDVPIRGNAPGIGMQGFDGYDENEANAIVAAGDDDDDDDELMLLAGQVENYERLRRFKMQTRIPNEPCDTSTPAKMANPREPTAPPCNDVDGVRCEAGQVPRQTIQQLAELVMKSARWRDAALNERTNDRYVATIDDATKMLSRRNLRSNVASGNDDNVERATERRDDKLSRAGEMAERDSNAKTLGWLQDRYCYVNDERSTNDRNVANRRENLVYDGPILPSVPLGPHPMGFTTENLLNIGERSDDRSCYDRENPTSNNYGRRTVGFVDDASNARAIVANNGHPTISRQRRQAPEPPRKTDNYGRYATLPIEQKNMIDRYAHENRGIVAIKQRNEKNRRDSDDDDDEFLDTTMSMQPARKTSITSGSTFSGKPSTCIIS